MSHRESIVKNPIQFLNNIYYQLLHDLSRKNKIENIHAFHIEMVIVLILSSPAGDVIQHRIISIIKIKQTFTC